MSYNTTGAYVELITSGFNDNANFTPYLIGSKLDAATVKSYVDYTESYVTGQSGDKYISALKIANSGQLPQSRERLWQYSTAWEKWKGFSAC